MNVKSYDERVNYLLERGYEKQVSQLAADPRGGKPVFSIWKNDEIIALCKKAGEVNFPEFLAVVREQPHPIGYILLHDTATEHSWERVKEQVTYAEKLALNCKGIDDGRSPAARQVKVDGVVMKPKNQPKP